MVNSLVLLSVFLCRYKQSSLLSGCCPLCSSLSLLLSRHRKTPSPTKQKQTTFTYIKLQLDTGYFTPQNFKVHDLKRLHFHAKPFPLMTERSYNLSQCLDAGLSSRSEIIGYGGDQVWGSTDPELVVISGRTLLHEGSIVGGDVPVVTVLLQHVNLSFDFLLLFLSHIHDLYGCQLTRLNMTTLRQKEFQ